MALNLARTEQTDRRTDERLQRAMSSPIKRFPGDGERRREGGGDLWSRGVAVIGCGRD